MANLKNITDLPVAASVEGLNLIVNDNGAAKQIAAHEVGAQADFAVTDENSPAFIKNKPEMVKSVNGAQPDESGNVQIEIPNNEIIQLVCDSNKNCYFNGAEVTVEQWLPWVKNKAQVQVTYHRCSGDYPQIAVSNGIWDVTKGDPGSEGSTDIVSLWYSNGGSYVYTDLFREDPGSALILEIFEAWGV